MKGIYLADEKQIHCLNRRFTFPRIRRPLLDGKTCWNRKKIEDWFEPENLISSFINKQEHTKISRKEK